MHRRRSLLRSVGIAAAAVAALVLVAGCGGSETETAPAGTDGTSAVTGSAAWRSLAITDVDGRSFTLASLSGKPVFVEAFATWCSNCRAQLADTQAAARALGGEATFVALSVETDLDPAEVASYADENGFADIRFAVMSEELLAAMADDLGTSLANPPATPHLVIAADGTPGALRTGPSSLETITGILRAAG